MQTSTHLLQLYVTRQTTSLGHVSYKMEDRWHTGAKQWRQQSEQDNWCFDCGDEYDKRGGEIDKTVIQRIGKGVVDKLSKTPTPTTTLTIAEIMNSVVTKCTINNGVRRIIRDKTYSMVKFLENDQMATRNNTSAGHWIHAETNWLELERFWSTYEKYMYQVYSQVRHNSQWLTRKYYMGEKAKKWLRWDITGVLTHCFIRLIWQTIMPTTRFWIPSLVLLDW